MQIYIRSGFSREKVCLFICSKGYSQHLGKQVSFLRMCEAAPLGQQQETRTYFFPFKLMLESSFTEMIKIRHLYGSH